MTRPTIPQIDQAALDSGRGNVDPRELPHERTRDELRRRDLGKTYDSTREVGDVERRKLTDEEREELRRVYGDDEQEDEPT